jgi:hypothetical protein
VGEIAPTSSAPPRLPPTSGEFVAKTLPNPTTPSGGTPSGGGGTTSGGGGGAAPTTIKAEVGRPLEPVVEATPGYSPGPGAGIGGAFQILQSMQWGTIQGAEIAKFEARFAELQPQIDAFHNKGFIVELRLIVEKPKSVDLLCKAGAFCDSGQFVYFKELSITKVEEETPSFDLSRASTKHDSMYPAGGRAGHIPYTHEGGSIIEDTEVPHLTPRNSSYRFEYMKIPLHPPKSFILTSTPTRKPKPAPEKPKLTLDPVKRQALADAPSEVYMLSDNIVQDRTAEEIEKSLAGNSTFRVVKRYVGGLNGSRTSVIYWSQLDKPRAEALAEIVRAAGIPEVRVEFGGTEKDPGHVQINFGRDAER